MTRLLSLLLGHWIWFAVGGVCVASIGAGAFWLYHSGVEHERLSEAGKAVKAEEEDLQIREKIDEQVRDAIADGDDSDGLRKYYRD